MPSCAITGPDRYFVVGSGTDWVASSINCVSPLAKGVSKAKPPFTTETKASAPVPDVSSFVNTKLSPMSKSKPPSSIIISVRGPDPNVPTWNNAPCPPPVNEIVALLSYRAPSFVIFLVPGIPVTCTLINRSFSADSVPCKVSPIWNVPSIVSEFTTNSVTELVPKLYLKTFSTIAVAFDVSPVIVLPTNSEVSPITSIPLMIFLVANWPSDTLKIFSLGYNVSAFSLKSKLKNILLPSAEPFDW